MILESSRKENTGKIKHIKRIQIMYNNYYNNIYYK